MRQDFDSLREWTRDKVTDRLTASGWKVDPVGASTVGRMCAFRRPVADEFAATALFDWNADLPRSRTPVMIYAEFGMSFGPAYRLWPLIEPYPAPSDIALRSKEDLGCRDEDLEIVLRSAADASAVVDRLDELAARAVTAGDRYTRIDAYLAQIEAMDEYDRARTLPVVLAAAGRPDQARQVLERFRRSKKSYVHDAEYRQFALALTRWLDAGAVIPDSDPIPAPPEQDDEVDFELPSFSSTRWSFSESWSEAKRRTAQRRAARTAVETQKAGKSREELRDLYRQELTTRGLDIDPVALDIAVDSILADSRAEKHKVGWKALGIMARSISAVVKDVKALGDAPPDWLEPPLEACYPASRTVGEWIRVDPSSDATATFARAIAGANHNPLRDDQIEFEAWLAPDETDPAQTVIAVHMGSATVAVLVGDDSDRWRRDLELAAIKGQFPAVDARLTQSRETKPIRARAGRAYDHLKPGYVGGFRVATHPWRSARGPIAVARFRSGNTAARGVSRLHLDVPVGLIPGMGPAVPGSLREESPEGRRKLSSDGRSPPEHPDCCRARGQALAVPADSSGGGTGLGEVTLVVIPSISAGQPS